MNNLFYHSKSLCPSGHFFKADGISNFLIGIWQMPTNGVFLPLMYVQFFTLYLQNLNNK